MTLLPARSRPPPYGAGGFYFNLSFLIASAGGDDVANAGLGVVDRVAPEIASAVSNLGARAPRFVTDTAGQTVDTAPPLYARMELPGGNVSYGYRPGGGGSWQWTRPGVKVDTFDPRIWNAVGSTGAGESNLMLEDPHASSGAISQFAHTGVVPFAHLPPAYTQASWGDLAILIAAAIEVALKWARRILG